MQIVQYISYMLLCDVPVANIHAAMITRGIYMYSVAICSSSESHVS